MQPKTDLWCNGSTTDFGSVCRSSSLRRSTMKRFFILILTSLVLFGCGQPASKKSQKANPFPRVTLPSMVSSEAQALDFMALNYWNKFFDSTKVFSLDTSFIGGISKKDFNGAFAEYATILAQVPPQIALQAQEKLISKAILLETEFPENNLFDKIVLFSEEVIYGVNSDYRNEEYYLPIAEALSKSDLVDSLSRKKYEQEVIDCSLNRLGTVATDFKFSTMEGQHSSLHKIKADYTLLFFSNPGCHACKDIITALQETPKIASMVKEKKLAVLNMYIDHDLTEWFKYMPIYPKEWKNAYDPDFTIRDKKLYSVRAIPSLYLLDKEKRVIYKDAPPQVVISVLERL